MEAAENEIKALESAQQELLKSEYAKRKNKACRNKIERGVVMEYVFVKDSEGYVFKKLANEVSADEKIITEKEYMKKSGLAAYEKEFGHGGARENAGRKQKFKQPLSNSGRKRLYKLCKGTSSELFSYDEVGTHNNIFKAENRSSRFAV